MSLHDFGLDTGPARSAAPRPAAPPSSRTGGTPPAATQRDAPQGGEKPEPDRTGFLQRVRDAGNLLRRLETDAKRSGRAPTCVLFSDMDVDGITSHTIMRIALQRRGWEVEPLFSKKFSEERLDALLAGSHDLILITDHGSPPRDAFGHRNVLVLDHHKPPDLAEDHSHQVHPVLHGLNGATEICSAGIAYLLARELHPEANADLSALACIGSAGDMLDHDQGRFVGLTRDEVIGDAVAAGLAEVRLDVRLYGRHGRTLTQMLMYADDPRLRGLSKDKDACQAFLQAQGVHPETHWCHLDENTRQRLVTQLLERSDNPVRLLGEVVELTQEPRGSLLRDVREYGTVINGSSRYEMPETVVALLSGDRGRAYERALSNYRDHKRNIVEAIRTMESMGIQQGQNLQWVHVEGLVRHTIIGSVAGAVQSKHDPDKPIIAFAYEAEDDTKTKVSGRGHRALCERGLDLSEVMREAAAALGGKGGGHDVAAGATIPAGTEPSFLEHAERILSAQGFRTPM